MARRCPPGVVCIENLSMLVALVALLGVVAFVHLNRCPRQRDAVTITQAPYRAPEFAALPWNAPGGVLLDPYVPPLRSDVPFPRGFPVNVRTQGVPAEYRQVGILTRGETILPLMGKPLIASRNTWNFYTMNDKNTMIKLPVVSRGKSCTGEYGCDNLYNGDTVYVEGYNDTFSVTMYDGDTLRYIPYL
jgi:hypothetical protein